MHPAAGAAWASVVVLGVTALVLLAACARAGRRRRLRTVRRAALWRAPGAAVVLAVLFAAWPQPAPVWSGDGSTGDLSQWAEAEVADPGGVVVVASPTPRGREQALRVTVRPGDRTFGQVDEERAEVRTGTDQTGGVEGQQRWYGWAFRLEEAPHTAREGFLSLTQWHQSGRTCPPNLALLAVEGRLVLGVRGGDLSVEDCAAQVVRQRDLGPVPVRTWTEVELGVGWSADPSKGWVSVRLDGRTVLARTPAATLYAGQTAYLKQGVYRSNSAQDLVLHLAGTVVGRSEAAVAPPHCDVRLPGQLLDRRSAWC